MKMLINYLRHKLLIYDPGFIYLKHAFKTLLAVILSVAIFFDYDSTVQTYAGMAAAYSMQGIIGETLKQQIKSILIAGGVYLATFFLGDLVHPYPLLAGFMMMVFAFVAMYVRRFGQRYMLMPIFAWTFLYFATVFANGDVADMNTSALGMVVGLLISAAIYLWLWPDNKTQRFAENFTGFTENYYLVLRWLLRLMQGKVDSEEFLDQIDEQRWSVEYLLEMNQNIIESSPYLSTKDQNKLLKLYLFEFDLAKALSVIFEALAKIYGEDMILDVQTRKKVKNVLLHLCYILKNIKLSPELQSVSFNKRLIEDEKHLLDFRDHLCQIARYVSDYSIALFNINIGFRMLWQILYEYGE